MSQSPKDVAWGAARMTQDADTARAKVHMDECLSHSTGHPTGKGKSCSIPSGFSQAFRNTIQAGAAKALRREGVAAAAAALSFSLWSQLTLVPALPRLESGPRGSGTGSGLSLRQTNVYRRVSHGL